MSFDNDPIAENESYPCECGGDITYYEPSNAWQCDECSFEKEEMKNAIPYERFEDT